jgi:hypothetical protein
MHIDAHHAYASDAGDQNPSQKKSDMAPVDVEGMISTDSLDTAATIPFCARQPKFRWMEINS